MLDSSVVKAHQHVGGAKKNQGEAAAALGRSRGGWTSKIHCTLNGQGVPLSFHLSGGAVHDIQYGALLLKNKRAHYVLGDQSYAVRELLEQVSNMESEAVIRPHQGSKKRRCYDGVLYKGKNEIEDFFNRLKHFRGIAPRYCKRRSYFLSAVQLAASISTILLIN